ncbi:DUF418 domain-containing protein [Sphingomonas canadensis]|uniref:DUF418 domain-containing protein n=1 Tax=Sphingomonas canadensis TaxID=1219257 RepID=A0ABW3H9I7_9SPHN|nr:DUF418 domain-containing protein [Sphingomonas canadensis]MCW3836401.1 DUF418 domain-containing protein [Sphingomonas canadensis]
MSGSREAVKGGGDSRLEVVDAVRGFALAGLFLVHMIESFELYWFDPKPGPISDAIYFLLMGKSFSLLALCFGFSFYILMDRAARRGVDFTGRFAWRLTVLFGIGTLHSWVYRGDIIQLLSAMGFLLLIAHRVKDNRVLAAVAALSLAGPVLMVQFLAAFFGAGWANLPPNHWIDPAMPVYVHGSFSEYVRANLWAGQVPKWWFMIESGRLLNILGLYIAGMLLGRIGFFARPEAFARARWIALAVAVPLGALLYYVREPAAQWVLAAGHGEAAARELRYLLGSWFDLCGTTIWALVVIALWQGPARFLTRPFAAMGRLTLTFYVAQSLVFVPVFYGFGLGLWDDWSQATRLAVGLGAVAAQMIAAHEWLRRFHYGPLEWAWRALTYRSWDVPFRKAPAAA